MPKLTQHCPTCGKQLILTGEFQLGESKLFEYKCGHIFSHDQLRISKDSLDFTSADMSGKRAREYQEDGIQFIIESDFNCIIGDQMRLGKTPQALLALKNKFKERTPALILVRSANLWQWIREYKTWTDILPNGIYPIIGSDALILGGFSAYIMSMDTFSSPGKCKCGHRYHEQECTNCKKQGKWCLGFTGDGNSMVEKLLKIPFKLIIADEAHSFKNSESNRSQALVKFFSQLNTGEKENEIEFTCSRCNTNWTKSSKITFDKRIGHKVTSASASCPTCGNYCYIQQQHQESNNTDRACGIVLLTGTAIKNRADEYFIPLNLVDPAKFPSLERFRNRWLQQNTKGQWNRVHEYKLDAFKQEIAPYVLRREKEDVFKDLPPMNRMFTLIEPDKDLYVKMYNESVDKMEEKLAGKADPSFWDLKEDLMELRRICGLMKIGWTSDYLEMSLLDSERQRYAVGIHHHSVRDLLSLKLGGTQNCLKLSGEDSSWTKDHIMRSFETSNQRVLIINMLAGGVGMDFHYVNNVVILERQWSSADEEQFEFRFYNPDLKIKRDSTNIEYILAKGTIDQFFHDMVEEKRKIFGETISNHWNLESDSTGSFMELCERTVSSRI